MQKLLGDIDVVSVYFDDIRIGGRSQEERDVRLREVLSRLKKAGLTLSIKKCELNKTSIDFLGHKLDASGISVSRDKVAAIEKIPHPRNVRELRVFLGMLNYYSKFISNYSIIVGPLYELLRAKSK